MKEIKEFIKERRTKMVLLMMEHPKIEQLQSKTKAEGMRAKVTAKKHGMKESKQILAKDRLGDSFMGQTWARTDLKLAECSTLPEILTDIVKALYCRTS